MPDTTRTTLRSTWTILPRGLAKGTGLRPQVTVVVFLSVLDAGHATTIKDYRFLGDWPKFFDSEIAERIGIQTSSGRQLNCSLPASGKSEIWRALFRPELKVRAPGGAPEWNVESGNEAAAFEEQRASIVDADKAPETGEQDQCTERAEETAGPVETGSAADKYRDPTTDHEFHKLQAGAAAISTVGRCLGLIFDLDAEEPATREELSRLRIGFDSARGLALETPWALGAESLVHKEELDTLALETPWTLVDESLLGQQELVARRAPQHLDIGERGFGSITARRMFDLARTSTLATEIDPATLAFAQRNSSTPVYHAGVGDQVLLINPKAPMRLQIWGRRGATLRAAQENGEKIELFAEDLMRGFAVDVSRVAEKQPRWRSICRRSGRYTIGETPIAITEEEGPVELAALASATQLRWVASEVAFRLDGWSLACPRPEDIGEGQSNPIGREISPPRNSLPLWRWGDSYRVRARPLDLACQSMFLESAEQPVGRRQHRKDSTRDAQIRDWEHFVQFRFKRVAPVPPPIIVPKKGQSFDLRQSGGDPQGLTQLTIGYDYKGDEHTVERRFLYPPASTPRVAELSGVLDLLDHKEAYEVVRRGDKGPPAEGDDEEIAYLPDPFARGVKISSTSGEVWGSRPSTSLKQDDGGDRPYARRDFRGSRGDGRRPIELVLRAARPRKPPSEQKLEDIVRRRLDNPNARVPPDFLGRARGPHWQGASRTLVVRLPPGMTYEAEIRSEVEPSDLSRHRVHEWLDGQPTQEDVVTPSVSVRFVHAVPKPVLNPVITRVASGTERSIAERAAPISNIKELMPRIARDLEDTRAKFALEAAAHKPTTATLVPIARWRECIDRVGQPPHYQSQSHVLATHSVKNDKEGLVAGLRGVALVSVDLEPTLPSTRHYLVDVEVHGTTRFRKYFEASKNHKVTSAISQSFTVSVLNTAPPRAPDVIELLPLTSTQVDPRSRGIHRARTIPGVRIYLDRGWFSSGDGELLAVIAEASGPGADPPARRTFSTWGNDPTQSVRASHTPIDFRPRADHAPSLDGRRRVRRPGEDSGSWFSAEVENHRLPMGPEYGDEGGQRVNLFLVAPQYDTARDCWFADVEFSIGDAFSPFVQLALARYQPESIRGAELSPVVRAQLIQPLPEVSVTAVRLRSHLEVVVRSSSPDSAEMTAMLRKRRHKTEANELLTFDPSLLSMDDVEKLSWRRKDSRLGAWVFKHPEGQLNSVRLPAAHDLVLLLREPIESAYATKPQSVGLIQDGTRLVQVVRVPLDP